MFPWQAKCYPKLQESTLIVFRANLEVGLRMLTDGAYLRRFGAYNDMATVAAFPHGDAALFKDSLGFHILQQCAVALLVCLLNGTDPTELLCQIMEALLVGLTGHAVVHIRPFGVLTLSGVEQVLGGIAQLAQGFEPQFCVLLLIFGGVQEQSGNLLVARLLGNRGKVGVLIPCLRFIDIL